MKHDIKHLKDAIYKLEKDLYFGKYDTQLRISLIVVVVSFVGASYLLIT